MSMWGRVEWEGEREVLRQGKGAQVSSYTMSRSENLEKKTPPCPLTWASYIPPPPSLLILQSSHILSPCKEPGLPPSLGPEFGQLGQWVPFLARPPPPLLPIPVCVWGWGDLHGGATWQAENAMVAITAGKGFLTKAKKKLQLTFLNYPLLLSVL